MLTCSSTAAAGTITATEHQGGPDQPQRQGWSFVRSHASLARCLPPLRSSRRSFRPRNRLGSARAHAACAPDPLAPRSDASRCASAGRKNPSPRARLAAPMGGRPGYLTLPIFSVVAAIGYVYYTTVFVAMPRWLGLSTAAGVANAAAFTALTAACLATYAVAVRRDPGRVPPGFVPDVEDAESTVHEIKRKVRSRWCCPTLPLSRSLACVGSAGGPPFAVRCWGIVLDLRVGGGPVASKFPTVRFKLGKPYSKMGKCDSYAAWLVILDSFGTYL